MSLELITIIIGTIIISTVILVKKKKEEEPISTNTDLLTLVNDLRKEIQDSNTFQRKEMEQKLDTMHERLIKNMHESSSTLQKHFKHTSGIVRDVTEKLTKLDETNKQVLGFSEQLQSLENILKNPKQRGILGE